MKLVKEKKAAAILVESSAFEGVRRIADTVAEDIFLVTGQKPEVLSETSLDGRGSCDRLILCATFGRSPLLEKLTEKNLLDVSSIQGKRQRRT